MFKRSELGRKCHTLLISQNSIKTCAIPMSLMLSTKLFKKYVKLSLVFETLKTNNSN